MSVCENLRQRNDFPLQNTEGPFNDTVQITFGLFFDVHFENVDLTTPAANKHWWYVVVHTPLLFPVYHCKRQNNSARQNSCWASRIENQFQMTRLKIGAAPRFVLHIFTRKWSNRNRYLRHATFDISICAAATLWQMENSKFHERASCSTCVQERFEHFQFVQTYLKRLYFKMNNCKHKNFSCLQLWIDWKPCVVF